MTDLKSVAVDTMVYEKLEHDPSKMASAIVDEFVEECGPDLHPIFSQTSSLRMFSESAKHQAEDFLEAMDAHKAALKETGAKLLDLRATYHWNDVIFAAEEAYQAYEKAATKPLRKIGRWMSTHAESGLPVLKLIPNDFYASIFYGGLKLVFESFVHLNERRLHVLRSFLRIPNIVVQAEACVKNFPTDGILFEKAEAVYCAALPAIEGTIAWLKRSPSRKHFRALLLGPRYNRSYKEKIQGLDEALNDLHERASILRDMTLGKVDRNVGDMKNILNRTNTYMTTMSGNLQNIEKQNEETREKIYNRSEIEQAKKDASEAIRIVLEQQILTAAWMDKKDRVIERLKRRVAALQKAEAALTESDLLDLMDVDFRIVSDDFRNVQRACQSLDLDVFNTTESIVRGPRMIDWITSDASDQLLFEGHSSCSFDRITPLSLLSTRIIASLRDKEPAMVIHYFCGSHTSSKDPLAGPRGIMRSLITQVTRFYQPKIDFVSKRLHEQLQCLQIRALCDCFGKLIRKVPDDATLFCVIDSISFFEKQEWLQDCREMMDGFRNILEDDEINPVFKLLITSPTRSRCVGNAFSNENRVPFPANHRDNSRHSLSERALAIAGSRPMPKVPERRRFAPSLRKKVQLRSASSRQKRDSDSDTNSDSSSDWGMTDSEMDVDTSGKQTPQPQEQQQDEQVPKSELNIEATVSIVEESRVDIDESTLQ